VRRRLDIEMVRRGIVASRSEARLAIRAGGVRVAGRPAPKAGTLVLADDPIMLSEPPRRFVSRGGEKLDSALKRFRVDVRGHDALDAGASTGGFTDCLLARGAARVIAADVGYGQLAWPLRADPRVVVLERTNVRDLKPEALPFIPSVLTADLSFISLRLAIPPLSACAAEESTFLLLVKPQFEAGRAQVGSRGVVTDPAAWRGAVQAVAESCIEHGLRPAGVIASPLLGPAGNVEFLLLARRHPRGDAPAGDPSGPGGSPFEDAVEAALDEANALRASHA
jgi:23S rRNA (cytidine1920-2'-O)/16S rRNA (cytidine1409-2'-O)-methyltransferase